MATLRQLMILSKFYKVKLQSGKHVKKINEVLQHRLVLESEIDQLKSRLGEDILDEESESVSDHIPLP